MEELREKRQGMGARIALSSSQGCRVDSGALHMLPEVEEEWTVLLMSEKAKAVCGFRIEEAALLEFLREDRHEYFLWITSQEVPQRDPVLNTLKESRKYIQEKESALDFNQAHKMPRHPATEEPSPCLMSPTSYLFGVKTVAGMWGRI